MAQPLPDRRDYITGLAGFMHGLRFEHMAPAHVHHTVQVIRDTVGAILAGSVQPEVSALIRLAPTLGGIGDCTIVGDSYRTTAPTAAMINAMAGVTLELDEGNQFATNHPAVHIFPAALAVAEAENIAGGELIAAFAGGYEVASRLGRATHLREAVHPFGTYTVCGAAAAAAKIMGLSADKIADALEIAAGLAVASSQTAAIAGASVRNAATGVTSANGVIAATLARAGVTGEASAMEAVFGRILGDGFKTGGIATDLGVNPYILRNYFKIQACSRWNHAAIEAAKVACAGKNYHSRDIVHIDVWTFSPATRLNWQEPVNGYAAKHSIPYNVAAQVVTGRNDASAYTEEAIQNAEVRAVARKTTVREDPAYTAKVPDLRPARVEITLTGGRVLAATVERALGGFDNPLNDSALAGKFRGLAALRLTAAHISALEAAIASLHSVDGIGRMTGLLRV